ncbi:MAG: type II secretion system F family protein [Deltaproteobacteria bacterium]|nr:type II secretion system F family protein [Deltaproteobacteria bacterium]
MNTLVLALLALGVGVFWASLQFFKKDELEIYSEEKLGEEKTRKTPSLVFKLALPVMSRFMVPWVRNLKIDNFRKKAKRDIISAGMEEEIDPDELFSFKILLALLFPTVIGFVSISYGYGFSPLALIVVAFYGYIFPYLWIKSRIKQRHQDIRRAMPFVVDLLTLSTEAGLDFMGSIARVVEKSKPGAFVDELRRALHEIQLGTSRADALRKMSWRIDMSEVSSFVAVLVSADQMGASIGRVLRAQADQIRNERFVRAEKMGAAAAQKVLLPLFFFILPAVFLVIFGPLVLRVLPDIGAILGGATIGG